ncbi:MAG: hypothetical protein ABW221_02740 [Vicinamibacteria bacterium]
MEHAKLAVFVALGAIALAFAAYWAAAARRDAAGPVSPTPLQLAVGAFYLVKSLPLTAVRWGVVVVVLYTAVAMLRSATREAPANGA